MRLFIDGREADMGDGRLPVSIGQDDVQVPDEGLSQYYQGLEIPMTARNMELMGCCEQIYAARFNSASHRVRIEEDGALILEGPVRLVACIMDGDVGRYRLDVGRPGREWVSHAQTHTFASLFPGYTTTLNGENIVASWTDDVPVRFLPVRRDNLVEWESDDMERVDSVLTEADYHPFIHVRSALAEIFGQAGYSLDSRFFDGAFGRSLHVSGNYHRRDVSLRKARMDFLAAAFPPKTAVADSRGIVYADPARTANSLGNIVDTADPREYRQGRNIEKVFSKGGRFYRDGDAENSPIAFKATEQVSMGFEYRLRYTTDYRIKNTAELEGFDTIYLGAACTRRFRLPNRFPDRRNEFRAGKAFRCFVSDFREDYRYELRASRIDFDSENPIPYGSASQTIAVFTSRMGAVQTSVEGTYSGLQVYEGLSAQSMTLYTGDWALYDGHVTETGTTDVSVIVRSPAERLTPSRVRYFNDVRFGGAAPGMRFLLTSAELRPVFQLVPTDGSALDFADVASHGISRMKFLSALRHMFNLHFYTDDLGRKVCVEPRRSFLSDSVEVDWTDRIDYSKPVALCELGSDSYRTLTRRYKGGDGAVVRWDTATESRFGSWSAEVDNVHVRSGESIAESPLFTASLNTDDCLLSAPSASLLQVGNASAQEDGEADLNFPPKIVCYTGVRSLPADEGWGWPSYGNHYPFLAFHCPDPAGGSSAEPDEGGPMPQHFTLCFEDRHGQSGLHRYWDGDIRTLNEGRRLSAHLRLFPDEIEAITYPNPLGRDFRALFILDIDGERSRWRLESVCDYDPVAASAKCVFLKED